MSEAPKQRIAQNYSLVWADGTIDTSEESWLKKISLMQSIISDVNIFTEPNECTQFLRNIKPEKVFLITSGYLGQRLVPEIHSLPQLDAIYIFCGREERHKVWIAEWSKVQGVFTSIEQLCESLKKVTRQYDHDAIPMSFVSKQTADSVTSGEQNLDQLEPSYMYSVLFKEIILEVDEDDAKSIQDLLIYCRQQQISESELSYFQREYGQRSPIWMYSNETFLYRILNKALRTLDIECMTKLGFFIRNLHWQLNQLNYEQSDDYSTPFTVYRGQQLSQKDFQHLLDTKGGLLAFNNFLSTSKEQTPAEEFVKGTLRNRQNNVGVLFIMKIDPSKLSASTTPFALIDDYSAFPKEKEILFSMHAIFRVNEIKQSLENNRLWEVQLTLTDDNDPQLAALFDRMREETQGSTGWYRMGKLMLKLGHFNQAQELYNELLNNASKDDERAYIYHHLGWVKRNQGEYKEAISFYEKSLAIKQKTLQQDDPKLAPTYNNIGGVYNNIGEYSKALEYYEKTLNIDKKTLPSNHPSLADSYNNIGLVCHNMGENSKALEFYEKAHKIKEEVLPWNHPDLATSYSNIAGVYSGMNDYLRALELYEKALQIREKVLPEDHPDLANSYSCIGQVYQNMSNYSKALELNEKVLIIFQKTYAPDHPNLATSYKNIGSVYEDMGDYLKALELYEKALQIYETSLAENHPDLASCYSCIGQVHNNIGNYSKAFEFYNKAMEIREKALPPDHPDVAMSYNNIGRVYNDMGDYSAALKALQNAFEIEQKAFQEGNQGFATTYNRFGRVYRNMKDYPKALDYFEKCLAIDRNTLPEGHPYQAITYSDIGDVHRLMGDYEKACSFHLRALNIQENIRCDPSECATTYTNLGETYREMKDYPTALSYFQKGLQIREEKLPKNHPDLAVIYHNLAKLYFSTGEYSIAMKNVQQAIDIAQEKLPSNHSDLLEYRKTLEEIRKKI